MKIILITFFNNNINKKQGKTYQAQFINVEQPDLPIRALQALQQRRCDLPTDIFTWQAI